MKKVEEVEVAWRRHLVPHLLLHGEHRTVYVVKGAKHLE